MITRSLNRYCGAREKKASWIGGGGEADMERNARIRRIAAGGNSTGERRGRRPSSGFRPPGHAPRRLIAVIEGDPRVGQREDLAADRFHAGTVGPPAIGLVPF